MQFLSKQAMIMKKQHSHPWTTETLIVGKK